MDSNEDSAEEQPHPESIPLIHPKACRISPDFMNKINMHWYHREEVELLNGLLFMLKKYRVHDAKTYMHLIKEVSTYLTFTLEEKADVFIILRKMRHLTDVWRHYKKFRFMTRGVSYNAYTTESKFGPNYWRSIEQETELDAYFRTYGFVHYEMCCRILYCYKVEQFASYIDEFVYATIPIGFALKGPDAFFYPIHRVPFLKVNKNEMVKSYKDSGWTDDDFDGVFYHASWDPYDDWEFIEHFVEVFDKWHIDTNMCFMLRVSEISLRYNKSDAENLTYDGILEKVRTIAYAYQLFKRFVFKTPGVEYNFLRHSVKVTDVYWNREGKVIYVHDLYNDSNHFA